MEIRKYIQYKVYRDKEINHHQIDQSFFYYKSSSIKSLKEGLIKILILIILLITLYWTITFVGDNWLKVEMIDTHFWSWWIMSSLIINFSPEY